MARVKCPKCSFVNSDGETACLQCKAPLPVIRISAQLSGGQDPAADTIQFQRGQIVANRYTVLQLVARGGMGLIYKVRDNTLNEEVALKTLLPQFVKDKLIVERFFNEARIARKLAHPHIARVHDIGQAGGIIYISMEYLNGASLRGILEKLPPGERMPIDLVLRVFDELCAALEYAHQFTIHRDIKPENVMVCDSGIVKLMDFGISKLMANTQLTGASVVMGTPFYMSPEQLRNSRDVDARADIFSVGVMLYEILTGNMPTGVPKPASQIRAELPGELDAIITRCVDPDPKNRYSTAAELRAALRAVRNRSGADAQRPERAAGRKMQLPLRRIAGAALAVFVLAATGAGVRALGTPEASSREMSGDSYQHYAALVDEARGAALQRAAKSEALKSIHDAGVAYLEQAESKRGADTGEAYRDAERAMQCFLGVLLSGEAPGMVFVPPGAVMNRGNLVEVPGFFIDEIEVTYAQFAEFTKTVEGGWREVIEPGEYRDHPVTKVTFYDAQGYAAWAGKQVPTDAQWARAAYGGAEASANYPWGDAWEEGAANIANDGPVRVRLFERDVTWSRCFDMAGNVSEWTRTVHDGRATGKNGEPYFGTNMTVRGGSYEREIPLRDAVALPYESWADDVGFRCIREVPSDPDSAAEILARFE